MDDAHSEEVDRRLDSRRIGCDTEEKQQEEGVEPSIESHQKIDPMLGWCSGCQTTVAGHTGGCSAQRPTAFEGQTPTIGVGERDGPPSLVSTLR